VIGPLVGLGLFVALDERFRLVFLIAGIPALAGLLFLLLLRERRPSAAAPRAAGVALRQLGRRFYVFLGISVVFALGNSSDVFLILRAKDVGLSTNEAVASYALFNAVYALGATPAGEASDRMGRRNVIGVGFVVFSIVYLGFATVSARALVWPLFALYGVYMAMTEGVARAYVTDFVPAEERATALGVYTGAMGVMVLVSSVLAGVLWDAIGASAPFYLGAATGAAALLGLVVLLPRRHAAV
jgi:MFS family permease